MTVEPTFRCATEAAIKSLAARFGLPNTPDMQDWEYQVATPERLSDFLSAYERDRLSDDERFCLMEIVIQSFEDFEHEEKWKRVWPRIEVHLRDNFQLHSYTIWYWANYQSPVSESWDVSAPMRRIFQQLS